MKIEDVELTEEHVGAKVTYVPDHAKNAGDPACQGGIISSWNDQYVFVNYGTGTAAATYPRHLVWG